MSEKETCEIMLISNSIISFVHFTLYCYLYTNTDTYNKSNLIECCSNLSGLTNKYINIGNEPGLIFDL